MENKYRKNFPFFKAIDENEAGENKGLIYFDTVAKFMNAHEAAEIVFTRNASESLNLVAYSRCHFHCGWSPVYSTHEGRCSGF